MRKTTFEHLADTPNLGPSSTFADYPIWRHTIALPPQQLMGTTGTFELPIFLLVGHSWAQLVSHFVRPNASVLDIGCGCGKTARFLINNNEISRYIGFDVLKLSIDWCSHHLTPSTRSRFQFFHADLYNAEYNPKGRLNASAYRFPVADSSVDVAFAASLFTHLLEADCQHYLRETARTLKPNGVTIISLHVEPEASMAYSGTEARIDVDIDYFIALAATAGLKLIERPGDLCGQEVLVFEPASPSTCPVSRL